MKLHETARRRQATVRKPRLAALNRRSKCGQAANIDQNRLTAPRITNM
jgi:hypothetical protein